MPSLKANGKRLNGKGSHWITAWKRLAIYLRDGMECQYCGRDLTQASARDISLDHVVPQCQGGSHEASNLITACINCNSRRQHLPVHVFVKSLAEAHYPNSGWLVVGEVADEVGVLVESYYRATLARINRNRRRSIAKHSANAKNIIAGRTQPGEQHTPCPKEV